MPASRARIAARHREKCAAPQALQLRLAIELESQLQTLRKLAQQPAIAGGIQACWAAERSASVARLLPAAGSPGSDPAPANFPRRARSMRFRAYARFGLALEGREAKRGSLERRDGGVEGRVGRVRAHSPAAKPAPFADRPPARCARVCRRPASAQRCWPRRPRKRPPAASALAAPTRR